MDGKKFADILEQVQKIALTMKIKEDTDILLKEQIDNLVHQIARLKDEENI